MANLPDILKNPFDPKYKIEDYEIFYIKECNELLSINKNAYALIALWTAVIINLQRRIEYFGIEIFLKKNSDETNYDRDENSLKERWLNVNEFKILDYSRKLNIINHATNSLLETLFWMKSNENEDDKKNISYEGVVSIVYLIEENLFLKEFKEDLRGKNPSIKNTKIKFRRKEDVHTDSNGLPSTYHNIMMKSGVKSFEENTKTHKKENHLIDKYI